MKTSDYYTQGTAGAPRKLLPVSFSCTDTHTQWYQAVTGRDMRGGGNIMH